LIEVNLAAEARFDLAESVETASSKKSWELEAES
jgi:hypothetical protein